MPHVDLGPFPISRQRKLRPPAVCLRGFFTMEKTARRPVVSQQTTLSLTAAIFPASVARGSGVLVHVWLVMCSESTPQTTVLWRSRSYHDLWPRATSLLLSVCRVALSSPICCDPGGRKVWLVRFPSVYIDQVRLGGFKS